MVRRRESPFTLARLARPNENVADVWFGSKVGRLRSVKSRGGDGPRVSTDQREGTMRKATAVVVAVVVVLVVAASASADPTGSKNATTFMASCDNGLTVPVVVNNANGQGAGTNNRGIQAEWAPAHVIGSSLVFHPAAFDLEFSFFDAGSGQTFTQYQVATRKNGQI